MSEGKSDTYKVLLRQQTALAKFGELALKSLDLDKILHEACRLVGDALGTHLAKIMELHEDGKFLSMRAGVGWNPGVVGQITNITLEDSSEGHALKTGKPMISPDIAKETRFHYPAFLIEHGVRAIANVVILGGEGQPPFGILQVDSREPRAFTDDDTTFLRSYANLIAAAVDRLRVIGELRDGAARLRASMDRQQAALETGLIGFYEWDVASAMVSGDKHFAAFYDLDPGIIEVGVPCAHLTARIHPDDVETVEAGIEAALTSGSNFALEFRLVHADGTMRWLLVRGHCHEQAGVRTLRYTGTAADVTATKAAEAVLLRTNDELEAKIAERTGALVEANSRLLAEAEERERIEEQLRQSHKMEAVGQLTGGLAHDFNNLLVGISGSLELMRMDAAVGRRGDFDRYIDAALTSASRAEALIHRLLVFSRRHTLDPRSTDVNAVLDDMKDLIRGTMRPAIRVVMRLSKELWPTLCDPNQLESALLNICINARDAMPEGGRLLVDTANAVLVDQRGSAKDKSRSNGPVGEFVVLSVTDIGYGMTPHVLARAFDPFFTTKPIGQGTGLGLSMIYGFVQQSGGHVELHSEPGQGTTVTIYLPRHAAAAAADDHTDGGLATMPPLEAPPAVVLVVDEEAAVRMVVGDVLSKRGYTVLEAADGRSGLHILENRAQVDLLVTDVGLPGGLNGRQFAEAARIRRPGLKVLFVTGYIEHAVAANLVKDKDIGVMTKPFAVDLLANRVQAMIGD